MGEQIGTHSKKRAVLAALLLLVTVTGFSPAAYGAEMPETLIPMGSTIGINIQCNGVMVIAMGEVDTENGSSISPALDAGLLPGDLITHVNEAEVRSSADFKSAVASAGANPLTVRVLRNNQQMQFTINPVLNGEDAAELGLWLRDGMAGIGTMTFYDPESGIFGALGHSVCDIETGVVMPLGTGSIMPASIKSVVRGEAGSPGELQGDIDFQTSIGTLNANTQSGIFGNLQNEKMATGKKALPVASENEVKLGPATILANVSGRETAEYSVEISRIFSGGDNRNMMITVTDEKLLELTGGIVQGMSGSPIIQEGKIIGAVTHVLINNPQKGYGISIGSMLSEGLKTWENAA